MLPVQPTTKSAILSISIEVILREYLPFKKKITGSSSLDYENLLVFLALSDPLMLAFKLSSDHL